MFLGSDEVPFNLGGTVCFSELVLWWGSDSVLCVFQIIILLSDVTWLWLDPVSVASSSLALLVCTCSQAAFLCLPAFLTCPCPSTNCAGKTCSSVCVLVGNGRGIVEAGAVIGNVQNDGGLTPLKSTYARYSYT